MTPVRERIFAAIEAALVAAGIASEIERMPSAGPTKFPALHIYDGGDSPDTGEAGTDRWAMSVEIEGTVEGGTGPEAHAAMNLLDAQVIQSLFVEPVLGGLATEIEADALRPLVAERASKRRLGFTRTLTIHYATRRGSPQVID